MWLPHSLTQQLHHEGRWIPFFSFLFFQMFHSKFFIECRQTCCAAKWKYNIIKIRHAIKLASVLMNITDLKQPLTNGISCLWRHFNKLLSSDINFHQDPTCHEINEKVHRSLVMMCQGWEIMQRHDAHSLYLKISIWNSWIDLSNKFINYVTTP